MGRIATLLLPLALFGCANVQGDGYYGCARGGRCPSTAPICGTDGLCHTSASASDAGTSDTGASDVGTSDAGLPPLTYPSCVGGTAGVCGSDTCYYDPVLGSSNDGYCTRHCSSDAECPAFNGAPSMCLRGQCARGCTGTADCTDGLACSPGRWQDGTTLRLCVSLVDAEANWYSTCVIDGDCERPLSCINGICLRPCTTPGDCVSFLEACVSASFGGHRGCLYECSAPSDCTTLDGVCTSGSCHPSATW